MLKEVGFLLAGLATVQAVGQQHCLFFPDETSTTTNSPDQVVFTNRPGHHEDGFVFASSGASILGDGQVPILTSSKDNIAIHLAVKSFVSDLEKVIGLKLGVYNDTLPAHMKRALIVGTSGSEVIKDLKGYQGVRDDLDGKWESFDMRALRDPTEDLELAVVISGSDRVSFLLNLRVAARY
jgi:hypothetical protein